MPISSAFHLAKERCDFAKISRPQYRETKSSTYHGTFWKWLVHAKIKTHRVSTTYCVWKQCPSSVYKEARRYRFMTTGPDWPLRAHLCVISENAPAHSISTTNSPYIKVTKRPHKPLKCLCFIAKCYL